MCSYFHLLIMTGSSAPSLLSSDMLVDVVEQKVDPSGLLTRPKYHSSSSDVSLLLSVCLP